MDEVSFNISQRQNLAAAYRMVDLFGWSDLSSTHISASMEEEGHFLINSRDQFFDEITASSLIEVGVSGELLRHNSELNDGIVNQAGFVIHSAIHKARPDVKCVIHTHTQAGMAVSAMKCGLLPLSQHALRFYQSIGIHEYEGVALDVAERERLVVDLGDAEAMILRNHGLLTVGHSIAEAFSAMYYLEKACRAQIDAMQSYTELCFPNDEVCQHTYQQYQQFPGYIQHDWNGLIRRLERDQPDFKN